MRAHALGSHPSGGPDASTSAHADINLNRVAGAANDRLITYVIQSLQETFTPFISSRHRQIYRRTYSFNTCSEEPTLGGALVVAIR